MKLYSLFSGETVMTGFTLTFSKSDFASETSSFFDASSTRLKGDIDQRLDERTTIKLGYSYIRNDNAVAEGSDYAYRSHQLNLRLERRFKNAIMGNIGYGYTVTRYLNRDSSTNFFQFRKNGTHNLSVGLSYWMSRKIRLYSNYAYVKNVSNLEVNRTLTREEFEEGQRLQTNSLGAFEKHTITTGFNLLF